MAQTILSVPIRPPWEFVECCVSTVRYLSSKLFTGVGNLSFMNLFFSTTFILKKSTTFKKCISRSLKIDEVAQDILFNQNVIAFYRMSTRRRWQILKRRAPHCEKNSLSSQAFLGDECDHQMT